MQSTGHTSMHDLSFRSMQGSAMMYVILASRSGSGAFLGEAAGADIVGAQEPQAVPELLQLRLAPSAHRTRAIADPPAGVEFVLEPLTGKLDRYHLRLAAASDRCRHLI